MFLEFVTIAKYSFDFANDTAIALPIPLLDPVIIAILFLIIPHLFLCVVTNIT